METWREITKEGMNIPVRIQVNGASMQPLIRKQRDYVTIQPMSRLPRCGDIVLFADDYGRYVVHRVKKEGKEFVITQGDFCRTQDPKVRCDQILGLATKVERGNMVLSLDSVKARSFGRFWMAIQPILWWCYDIGRIYRKLKNR